MTSIQLKIAYLPTPKKSNDHPYLQQCPRQNQPLASKITSNRFLLSLCPIQVTHRTWKWVENPCLSHWSTQFLNHLFAITFASSALVVLKSSMCWIRQQLYKQTVVKPTWLPSSNCEASLRGHKGSKRPAEGKPVERRRGRKNSRQFECSHHSQGTLVGEAAYISVQHHSTKNHSSRNCLNFYHQQFFPPPLSQVNGHVVFFVQDINTDAHGTKRPNHSLFF